LIFSLVVICCKKYLTMTYAAASKRFLTPACKDSEVDAILTRLTSAKLRSSFAVLVLPGSFNPVHTEHVHMLEIARAQLEKDRMVVIAGFLQPSSDAYVGQKCGKDKTMCLADRIRACDIAAESAAKAQACEQWIYTWQSGTVNGAAAVCGIADAFNRIATERLRPTENIVSRTCWSGACDMIGGLRRCIGQRSVHIVAYQVCGADFVERCGGWSREIDPPLVVVARPGVALPSTPPATGWQLAEGDTSEVSSTSVRSALLSGKWDQLVDVGCHDEVVQFLRAKSDAGALFTLQ